MDPAIDDFHVVVSELDLARPDAPAKVSEFGRVLSPIYRLARRIHQQEGHGVKDMATCRIRKNRTVQNTLIGLSKILLKINPFLCVIGDDQTRNDRQVGIPVVQESSFLVHQPRGGCQSPQPAT